MDFDALLFESVPEDKKRISMQPLNNSNFASPKLQRDHPSALKLYA